MIVVVITGPIASGKSHAGSCGGRRARGPWNRLRRDRAGPHLRDARPESATEDRRSLWREARRLAGHDRRGLGRRSGRLVIVEGEFATDGQRADLRDELPTTWRASFVTLTVEFDVAWRRAMADPTRGISKDKDFLAAHYRALANAQQARRPRPRYRKRLCLARCTLSGGVAARGIARRTTQFWSHPEPPPAQGMQASHAKRHSAVTRMCKECANFSTGRAGRGAAGLTPRRPSSCRRRSACRHPTTIPSPCSSRRPSSTTSPTSRRP